MLNNSIVELLLRNRQAVVHMECGRGGRFLVTVEVDGQYVTGTVSGWNEAIQLIQRGVKQIVIDFMNHIVDTHDAFALAEDTARYFNLFTDDGVMPSQLIAWALEVIEGRPVAPRQPKQNRIHRLLQMVGLGSLFLIISWFLWLLFTNQIAF